MSLRLRSAQTLAGAFGSYELRLLPDAEVDFHAALVYLEDAEAALRAGKPGQALAAADVAANLARRPFLPGDDGRWIDQKCAEMSAVLVRALEMEVELLPDRADYRYALRLAEEAVALGPFRDRVGSGLMRVHLASGNRAEGLRADQRCRSLLAEELGVPPSAVTEATYLDLLHADAPPTTPSASTDRSGGLVVGGHTDRRFRTLLVGDRPRHFRIRPATGGTSASTPNMADRRVIERRL